MGDVTPVAVRAAAVGPRRAAGWSAVATGPLTVLGVVTGIAFSGDGPGPEHPLHWVSHLVGTPAGLAVIGALAGVLWLERGALGRAGLVAAAVAIFASAAGAVGGALVGWAGGIQGVTEGGLYDLGHRIGDLGVVGLPASLVLGVVVARRARVLPRWSGWLPLASVPVAILAGVVLGALGHDAGSAAHLVFAAPAAQYVVWGHRMLSAPAAPGPGPVLASPEPVGTA